MNSTCKKVYVVGDCPWWLDLDTMWGQKGSIWTFHNYPLPELLSRREPRPPRQLEIQCQWRLDTENEIKIHVGVSYKVLNTFWISSKARSHKLSKQINVPKLTPKSVVKVVNAGWLGTSKMGSMNRFSFQCLAISTPDLSNTKFVLYMLKPSSWRHSV